MSEALPFTVRPMTDDDAAQLGWEHDERPAVIDVTKDGYKDTVFIPAQDPELNGPGHLLELVDGELFSHAPQTEDD